jgi:hypothetical protein
MRRRAQTDLSLVALAPAIAVVGAALAFATLSGLARPDHYGARMRGLNDQLSQAEAQLHGAADAGAYPAKALCRSSADQAALDLRQRLQSQAAAASVAVADVLAAPAATESPDPRLVPVTLQFTASGRYEQVVALLSSLAKSQPEIFVDTLDLRPDAANARLKLTGRVFCSSSARP